METNSGKSASREWNNIKDPFIEATDNHLEQPCHLSSADPTDDIASLLNSGNFLSPWDGLFTTSKEIPDWSTSLRMPPVRKQENFDRRTRRKSPVLLPLRKRAPSKNGSVPYSPAQTTGYPGELRMLKAKQLMARHAAKMRSTPYPIKNFLRARADHSQKEDTYKTVMCQAWLEKGWCGFGDNCKFAHGESDLRPSKMPIKNAKYKTKLCENYTVNGVCPYGTRCLFIHPSGMGSNAYIRSDRLAMMVRERAALNALNGQSVCTLLPSNCTTPHPPPSWPLDSLKVSSDHQDCVKTGLPHKAAVESDAVTDSPTPPVSSTPPSVTSDSTPELQNQDPLAEPSADDLIKDSFFEVPSTTILGLGESPEGEDFVNPDSGKEGEHSMATRGWSVMDPDPFNFSIYTDSQYRQLASIFSSLMS